MKKEIKPTDVMAEKFKKLGWEMSKYPGVGFHQVVCVKTGVKLLATNLTHAASLLDIIKAAYPDRGENHVDAIVQIEGGIAEVVYNPSNLEVEIIDLDCYEEGADDDEDKRHKRLKKLIKSSESN